MADLVDSLIRNLPLESDKRFIFWDALDAAVNCEVQEESESEVNFCICGPGEDNDLCAWCHEGMADAAAEARLAWD